MKRALLVGSDTRRYQDVILGLIRAECVPEIAADLSVAVEFLERKSADLIALDLAPFAKASAEAHAFIESRKSGNRPQPFLGLAPAETDGFALLSEVDDFVLPPFRASEIAIRTGILLKRARPVEEGTIIHCGGLIIDLARYEAMLDGVRLDLTFKEYELLRFLASTPGNVFTREILLNKVWGYDYFGGTRTVDVHIRRLRSKIETTSTFIETVRNVGYRFKEP